MRLIDADALIHEYYKNPTYPALCKAINNAPTITDRPTGKWIWSWDGVRCSNCNYKIETTGIPSFCPNCGCRMEVEDE